MEKKPTTTLETYFRSELRIFCILTAFHDTWTRRLGLLTLLTCRRCCCCYFVVFFFDNKERRDSTRSSTVTLEIIDQKLRLSCVVKTKIKIQFLFSLQMILTTKATCRVKVSPPAHQKLMLAHTLKTHTLDSQNINLIYRKTYVDFILPLPVNILH